MEEIFRSVLEDASKASTAKTNDENAKVIARKSTKSIEKLSLNKNKLLEKEEQKTMESDSIILNEFQNFFETDVFRESENLSNSPIQTSNNVNQNDKVLFYKGLTQIISILFIPKYKN